MDHIYSKYTWLKNHIDEVEKKLLTYTKTPNGEITKGIAAIIAGGGKRIRPALTIIAATFGEVPEDLARYAAVPESIHLGSLIHDDIIDQADFRRGVPTIHQQYGITKGIYAGDLVFMKASQEIAILCKDDYSEAIFQKITAIVQGEIHQLNFRFNPQISFKDYLRIIDGKTAKLIELSLLIGAMAGGVPKSIERDLVKIGHYVGLAFQIRDDILDYESSAKKLGKPTMADYRNGYFTLPFILKLRKNPDFYQRAKWLSRLWRYKKLRSLLSDEVDQAKAIANRYEEKAMAILAGLPEGEGKQALTHIITYLNGRNK